MRALKHIVFYTQPPTRLEGVLNSGVILLLVSVVGLGIDLEAEPIADLTEVEQIQSVQRSTGAVDESLVLVLLGVSMVSSGRQNAGRTDAV